MTRFIRVAPEKGTPTLAGGHRPGDAISGGVTMVLYHTLERGKIPLPLCSRGCASGYSIRQPQARAEICQEGVTRFPWRARVDLLYALAAHGQVVAGCVDEPVLHPYVKRPVPDRSLGLFPNAREGCYYPPLPVLICLRPGLWSRTSFRFSAVRSPASTLESRNGRTSFATCSQVTACSRECTA